MLLVSVTERSLDEPRNYSTVENLNDLYRGLCSGLDVQKFLTMSNFNLFICQFTLDFHDLINKQKSDIIVSHPFIENLADTVYGYMTDNLDVYFDIVKSIDEYREKIKNYKLDK